MILRGAAPGSEALDPRALLHLPGPGAARLRGEGPVGFGDGVGVEHRVGPVRRLGAARIADAAVDDEVADAHALRRELARQALGEAPERELAHREGRGARIALHAGAG